MALFRRRSDRQTWYRTPVARGFAEGVAPRVDRTAGTLRGFIVMQTGVAKGHREEVDDETLDRIVTLTEGRAVKMRFGHPSMSDDAIGKAVGRASNFRRDGDRVIADAALLQSAATAPNGDLRQHILDLAEEAPDLFGTSVVITRDLEFRKDENGEPKRFPDGEKMPPLIRPTAVLASDFVDSPAATPSLFSETNVLLSAEADELLGGVLNREDAAERCRIYLNRFEADHPGASDIFRAALGPDPLPEEPMPNSKPPETAGAVSNEEALRQLKAAGYSVQPPATDGEPDGEPAPEAGDNAVLSEIRELRKSLDEERKARLAAEKKAAEKEQAEILAPFRARLDRLTHLADDDRKAALDLVESYLAAGDTERAEKFTKAHERIPDPLEFAEIERQVSVPIADGEQAQVDISRYAVLAAGDDGELKRVMKGDPRAMAQAAWITDNIEDPDEKRKARAKLWAEQREAST